MMYCLQRLQGRNTNWATGGTSVRAYFREMRKGSPTDPFFETEKLDDLRKERQRRLEGSNGEVVLVGVDQTQSRKGNENTPLQRRKRKKGGRTLGKRAKAARKKGVVAR